jgi:cytochrome c-type biogenesis protein
MALGFTASAIGNYLIEYRDWIAKIGGVVVIVLGLNMIGVFKIPFLMMDKRVHVRSANRSYLASFAVGLGFAAGWSPCVGPILASILALATQEKYGSATLLLGLPFFITAAAISRALGALNRIKRYLGAIEIGAGAFLVATGLVLFTGTFGRVAGFFYQYVKPPNI